ncbi:MAG: uracil-DNA glycosylase [Gammaproteobacteria bacterium]
MGIPVWVRRASVDAGGEEDSEPVSTMDWEALEGAVAGCVRCGLHAGRTRTVFGVGSRTADLMIIGEAPGAEEDRRGEPFVGRAGKLLDAMLAALGLDRRTVFIANILKCRPPQNRDPRPDEAATCAPYLARQIELISPRLILAVGRVAAQNLLQTEAPLGRLRGRLHPLEPAGVPVLVTYHPAFLLRRLEAKADAWRDLLSAAAFLRSGDAR